MQTRAKFYVSSRESGSNPPGNGAVFTWSNAKLNAAYSPDEGTENHLFWKASPTGQMQVSGKTYDVESMEPGGFFYVDVEASEAGNWKLTKLELQGSGAQLNVTLSGVEYADTLTVGIQNKVVWPLFMNRLGETYSVTLTPTTKSGS